MIERVEILKDGASAVYGADAVAGVVNIITRPTSRALNSLFQTADWTDSKGQQDTFGLICRYRVRVAVTSFSAASM